MVLTGVYTAFNNFWNNWRISMKLGISCRLMPLHKAAEGQVQMYSMTLDKPYEPP